MKNAKQYFEHHDQVDKLYFTSDNLAFFDKQNAMNHSLRLEDDTVTALTREEVCDELHEMTAEEWEQEMENLLDELDED
jgi:hypothetical protein